MDFKIGSLFVLGLLALSDVCSGAYRGYRSYRSYRSYGSSYGSSASSGGVTAGIVIGALAGAAFIAFIVIFILWKKGIICASPKVTATPSSAITIVDKNSLTGNYTTGFVNPPPPPTYSAVYPPPSYSNGNVSAPDPAYPPTATVSQ